MDIAETLKEIHDNVLEVYKAGKKAQEQEFWDGYMKSEYTMDNMFAGRGWNVDNFKPVKKMYPWSASGMFQGFDGLPSYEAMDMVEHLKKYGVTLDFSRCVSMQNCFGSANISRLGVIDIRMAKTTYYGIFASKYLKTVDELIVDENVKYSSLFNNATALENLTITGTIGQNGFSVAQSTKLSRASIISIINALSDTTTALTVTLSKTAVDKAFETSPQASDGSQSAEWTALEGTKTNWTISLV